MRRVFNRFLKIPMLLLLTGLAACSHVSHRGGADSSSRIKMGFTTQNFLSAIPVSEESAQEFISYAKGQGFSWIELRDPDASLTVEECRRIAAFAERSGIEVVYSMQRGLLAADFEAVFERVLVNITAFNGPNLVRVLALRGDGEQGWSEDEFNRAVAVANQAARRAKTIGYRLMVENADVVLDGSGKGCRGMVQLVEAMDPSIFLQLDTANLFTGPVPLAPQEAEAFIRTYARRIPYVHLKSARDRQAQPVLGGNPLGFKTILSLLTDTGTVPYVAIELASGEASGPEVFNNMQASLNWLKQNQFIKTP